MAAQATPTAVLLDALGTLVRLEPPAPRLRARLRAHTGIDVGDAAAARAMRAEIAFYRRHLHLGGDRAGLERVRDGCVEVVARELGLAAPPAQVRSALLEAIEFSPYDDVPPALRALRERGIKLAVVSNWDVSLHEMLERTGLRALVDAAVASAEVGVAKPDPRPFALALERLGADPAGAWHVGDTPEEDVAGAVAAGVRPVLVDRDGRARAPRGVRVVRSLGELLEGGH